MPDTAPVPIDPRRCVVIPSYNGGPLLERTVREVLAVWQPLIVVDDGSTDGSADAVVRLARTQPGLHVLAQSGNTGKGAAVFAAFNYAIDRGFTQAAVFDADGQHHTPDIPRFMEAARANPAALIAGKPVFGDDAPRERVYGHRLANFWTRLEGGGHSPADSLCGLRVYPLPSTCRVLAATHLGRGFDFETVAGVLLAQQDVRCLDLPTPIRYAPRGVSYFR